MVWLVMPESYHLSARNGEQGLRTANDSSHPISVSSFSVLISPEESPGLTSSYHSHKVRHLIQVWSKSTQHELNSWHAAHTGLATSTLSTAGLAWEDGWMGKVLFSSWS